MDPADADTGSVAQNAWRSCAVLDADLSHAEIGTKIGRDRTVIWREVTRNSNPDGDYHALMAHARASQKAVRPKQFKLIDHPQCARIGEWMDDGCESQTHRADVGPGLSR